MMKIHEDRFLDRFRCCPKRDEVASKKVQKRYNFPMPYAERKSVSSHFRARVFQVTLELVDLITDVLFLLINLAPAYDDLFFASLCVIVVSFIARMLSALAMRPLADFSRRRKTLFYWSGFFVNLFETNIGLYLMKRSFIMKATRFPFTSAWERDEDTSVQQKEPDQVYVFARNDLRSGGAEILNILAVTVVEDIPQLVIQLIYFQREGTNGFDFVFYATLATTLMHVVLQWIEGIVTLFAILFHLRAVQNFREIMLDKVGIDNLEDQTANTYRSYCDFKPRLNPLAQLRKIQLEQTEGAEDDFLRREDTPSIFKLDLGRNVEAKILENKDSNCLTKLKYLSYFESHDVSPKSIINVLQSSPYLLVFGIQSSFQFTDDVLETLSANCRMLTVVKMNCENLGNMEGVVNLANNLGPRLRWLALSNAPLLSDSDLREICTHCWKLEALELRCCLRVSNYGLQAVYSFCGTLKAFACSGAWQGSEMAYQELVDGDAIARILSNTGRNLFKLDLESTLINDDDLKKIAACAAGLKVVWLTNTSITSTGVSYLARDLANSLVELWIGYNRGIDDAVFEVIPYFRRLELLMLNETSISDEGIMYLAHHYTQTIKHLYCGNCSGLHGNNVAKALAKHCMQLQDLHLQSLNGLTDEGVIALATKLRRLQRIHLRGCPDVTKLGLKCLLKFHPEIQIDGYTGAFSNPIGSEEIEQWRNSVKKSLRYKLRNRIKWGM